jgi:hypothetical protein
LVQDASSCTEERPRRKPRNAILSSDCMDVVARMMNDVQSLCLELLQPYPPADLISGNSV